MRLLIVLFLLAATLFIQLPYYGPINEEGAGCVPVSGGICIDSIQKWQLGESLAQKILTKLSILNGSQNVNFVATSPAPETTVFGIQTNKCVRARQK